MNLLPRIITLCLLATAVTFLTQCSKKSTSGKQSGPQTPEALEKNQLADSPSAILSHAAASRINWQPWTPESLEHAKQSDRPLFALLVSAHAPGSLESILAIEENAEIVQLLNTQFVPVLADVDINRELALMAARYAKMQNQRISFPFVFILSPDGAPISSQSIAYQHDDQIVELLTRSMNTISRMWSESRDYMLNDSGKKLTYQQEVPYEPLTLIKDFSDRTALYRKAIRRLTSFYDPDTGSFYGSGGVFPHGLLDSFAIAAVNQELPESLREKSHASLSGLIHTLSSSAMIDPLDGGIYKNRQLATWDLPNPLRDTETQAVNAGVFAQIAKLQLHDGALPIAINAVTFAENNFLLENGLFSQGVAPSPSGYKPWMWTTEQIQNTLNDQEAKLWTEVAHIKELGNMPYDVDSTRKYYRYNSLAVKSSIDDAAKKLGLDTKQAQSLFESGRQKLLAARQARLPKTSPDPNPSANASFRMVTAYAHLYTATGDETWKNKALSLGRLCRDSFASSRFLRERLGDAHPALHDASSYTYTLAARAALDLADISLDREWGLWAQDLVSRLSEHFINRDGMLITTRPENRLIPLPIEDAMMIFSDSTAGLLIQTLARLRAHQLDIPPDLRDWLHGLPAVHQQPVSFTDFIKALATSLCREILDVPSSAPEDMQRLATQMPLDLITRRRAETPGQAIQATSANGKTQTINSIEALKAWQPWKNQSAE